MHLLAQPVTLEGTYVRLEPLAETHLDGLCEIGLDADLWQWTVTRIRSREAMQRYIEDALAQQEAGTALPFVTTEQSSGAIIGSTRYGNIDPKNRRLEIGWTWLARPWQRTALNTEAKYVMLRHAFETLGCIRVELKTDVLNERSRRAILRIGAKEEGILRKHVITKDGRVRDTIYYSILDDEWPAIRVHLESLLASEDYGESPDSFR
jgi:RimJ/RimL family protein N-acetyltransferase